MLLLWMMLFLLSSACLAVEPVLPDPDPNQVANHTKPVQVFIMMGQSNMLGFGTISKPNRPQGTLEALKDTYPHLVDDNTGEWTVRKDVRTVYKNSFGTDVSSFLQVGQGAGFGNEESNNRIGPELQFGHVLGHVLEEPVLLLKVGTGNRGLGWDFKPPGTPHYNYGDSIYAGYGQCPDKWSPTASMGNTWLCDMENQFGFRMEDTWFPRCYECSDGRWYAGTQYDKDKESARHVLDNIADYFPGYLGQGFEIGGFVFWQGHKDTFHEAYAKTYEANLVQYIRALRQDYKGYPGGENAPFVLATVAFEGCNVVARRSNTLDIWNAQMAVSGDAGNYMDLANVKTVDARTFWRERADSPCNADSHYNCNAETYMEVGNALGWAMADLIQNEIRLEEHSCPAAA